MQYTYFYHFSLNVFSFKSISNPCNFLRHVVPQTCSIACSNAMTKTVKIIRKWFWGGEFSRGFHDPALSQRAHSSLFVGASWHNSLHPLEAAVHFPLPSPSPLAIAEMDISLQKRNQAILCRASRVLGYSRETTK